MNVMNAGGTYDAVVNKWKMFYTKKVQTHAKTNRKGGCVTRVTLHSAGVTVAIIQLPGRTVHRVPSQKPPTALDSFF